MPIIDKAEWRSHGLIIPAAMAGNMLIATHNYALGAAIPTIERTTGWARAEISMGPMFPGLLAILVAPLVGILIDRWGARRVALIGVPTFCTVLACLSLASSNVVTWWLLYLLVGLASLLIFPSVWTSAINWRFDRNRGIAIALAISGTGLAATSIPVITAALAESYGWRTAYALLGVGSFAVVFPLVYFLFDKNSPRLAAVREGRTSPGDRAGLHQTFLSRRFLTLAVAAFLFALVAGSLSTNAVPILMSEGFTVITAASLAGLIGIGSIGGRLLGGVLLDRFPANRVAAATVCVPALSIAVLLTTQQNTAGCAAACLLFGLAVGAEYDSVAYLASRHFPLSMFGALFGALGGLLLFGTSVSPVVSNHFYDLTRTYDAMLLALLGCGAVSASLFLSLGMPDRRGRRDEFAGRTRAGAPRR